MKNLVKSIWVVICYFSISNAQVMEKKDVFIDVYAGYSLVGTAFKSFELGNAQDSKVTNIPPLGLRVQYMISPIFSLGLDGFFIQNTLNFKEEGSGNNFGNGILYDYRFQRQKVVVYFTFNWHLLKKSEDCDLELTLGAGFNRTIWSQSSNEPGYENQEYPNLIPISIRFGTTFRYFFTPNFGLNIGASIGGPLLTGGLSFKI